MKTPTMHELDTPALRSAVSAYLLARAYAETMREAVEKIYRGILEESSLMNDLDVKHGFDPRRITDPCDVYLCLDEALLKEYYAESDRRLREAGLKPEDMEKEKCPALVAESLQSDAERLIVEITAKASGFEPRALLSAGLDNYRKWLDLHIRLVFSFPGYEPPKM